ncbi:MAG: molybdopterin molybdotransferase MoeA [Spirochaetales bacterium]|nr:MAG: molybdopterin molybdotransferase MoeA [Spirochaetales bacterium]
MISVSEADKLLQSIVIPEATENVALGATLGRVLREDVCADRDLPPFDRVTMDGIALSSQAWRSGRRQFRIEGISPAGSPARRLADSNACIRVMTGTVMPQGADLVIPVEELGTETPDHQVATLETANPVYYVHEQGSDRRAGEVLLHAGTRLTEQHLGILAAVGSAEVTVSKRPRIVVAPTGDELVPVETTPLQHQIRGSNEVAVVAALESAGYPATAAPPLRDDRSGLRQSLEQLLHDNDVIILSGGVSAGSFDFVPSVLMELGVKQLFHKLRERPGKPLWVGTLGERNEKVVFGLPGNPVSTLVGTVRHIIPFLHRRALRTIGATVHARLAKDVESLSALTLFLAVRLEAEADGTLLAHPIFTNSSGDFSSLAGADGFIELPPGQGTLPAGFSGPVYLFGGRG